MKRTIPQLREAINRIAHDLDRLGLDEYADQLFQIEGELVRASPIKRAKVKHHPLTESEKSMIRDMVKRDPDLHLDDIAKLFNVNAGRVSEALREK